MRKWAEGNEEGGGKERKNEWQGMVELGVRADGVGGGKRGNWWRGMIELVAGDDGGGGSRWWS